MQDMLHNISVSGSVFPASLSTMQVALVQAFQELLNFLQFTCGYILEEINKNRDLWLDAQATLDPAQISNAWGKCRTKDNPKAYFIAKVRGMVSDQKNKPQNVWQPEDTR